MPLRTSKPRKPLAVETTVLMPCWIAASNSACLPGGMRMSAISRIIVAASKVGGGASSLPRRGGSNAERSRQRVVIAGQRARRARHHDQALLEHDRAIGVRQHRAVVAIDDQRADAGGADRADHAPDLGDDQRREAFG